MSFAYMPLYTGDYIRDTLHLSCAEHGIYLRLLMYCWDVKGPAPLDERKRCGIVNARSGDEVEALRRVTAEFFVQMEDGWYNERMQNEVVKSEMLSKSRSEYGRTGAAIKAQSQVRRAKEAQAKHKLSISQAQAKHELLTPTPTSSSSPTPEVQDQKKDQERGATSSPNPPSHVSKSKKRFEKYIDGMPESWRIHCKTKRPFLDPDETYEAFSDWWTSSASPKAYKLDWDAAFRTWVRLEKKTPQEAEADQQREKQKYML